MLTKEQILDSADEVLRKFGPRKTTVVDVARLLKVSHGTVYRHFTSKAELHEAIIKRWLERVTFPLIAISERDSSAKDRLREWFVTLMEIKHSLALKDPEMFESYTELSKDIPSHVKFEHISTLLGQVEIILSQGADDGVFEIEDVTSTAKSFFFGTVRYHHPVHAQEWNDEYITRDFDQLFTLLEKAILR